MFPLFLQAAEVVDSRVDASEEATPGELLPAESGPLVLNSGRRTQALSVTSFCDRPIQVRAFVLTHVCLRAPLENVVRICDIFDNNFGINGYFTKYLKDSCW